MLEGVCYPISHIWLFYVPPAYFSANTIYAISAMQQKSLTFTTKSKINIANVPTTHAILFIKCSFLKIEKKVRYRSFLQKKYSSNIKEGSMMIEISKTTHHTTFFVYNNFNGLPIMIVATFKKKNRGSMNINMESLLQQNADLGIFHFLLREI